MTDMPKNNDVPQKAPLPPAPDGVTDPDRLEGAAERWEHCPLKDCKRDMDLLYADFYLRDIRTDRLLCSACVVRTEIGYQAKEVVREFDNRFFDAKTTDYIITFAAVGALGLAVNALAMVIGFWFLSIFIGGAAGTFIGQQARRLTGKRIGRQSAYVATGAAITSALLAPIALGIVRGYGAIFFIQPSAYFSGLGIINLSLWLCAVPMASAIYGIFMRRI